MYQRYLCYKTEVYSGFVTKIRVSWNPGGAYWQHRDAVVFHSTFKSRVLQYGAKA